MRGVEENDCEGEEEPWDESVVFRQAGDIRNLVIFSKLLREKKGSGDPPHIGGQPAERSHNDG